MNVEQPKKDADAGALGMVFDADRTQPAGIMSVRDLAMGVEGADLDSGTTLAAEVMARTLVDMGRAAGIAPGAPPVVKQPSGRHARGAYPVPRYHSLP